MHMSSGSLESEKVWMQLMCLITKLWLVMLHFPDEYTENEKVSGCIQVFFGLNITQFHPVRAETEDGTALLKNGFSSCISCTISNRQCVKIPKTDKNLSFRFFERKNLTVFCTQVC